MGVRSVGNSVRSLQASHSQPNTALQRDAPQAARPFATTLCFQEVRMANETQSVCIMSLRDSVNSCWGSVDRFLDGVRKCPTKNGRISLESEVWGKVNTKEELPRPGQGLAFYHSTRALFPQNDPHNRQPRVTAIGRIEEVETEGKSVTYIEVSFDKAMFNSLRNNPIVRSESTSELFNECGIRRGSVATFYMVPPKTWPELLSHVRVKT